jgi:hypothetical protein
MRGIYQTPNAKHARIYPRTYSGVSIKLLIQLYPIRRDRDYYRLKSLQRQI